MIKESNSQAGQDRFVDRVLDGMREGIFVDCGCNDPIKLSNTYALEKELGWRGLLVDSDENCVKATEAVRLKNNKVFQGDGTTAAWAFGVGTALHLFAAGYGPDYRGRKHVDYLSLDCDAATPLVLERILEDVGARFRVLTIEHDAYRFGPEPRSRILTLLRNHGYDVLCPDVMHENCSFEAWAVDPKLVDESRCLEFCSIMPTDWKAFFA